MGADDVGAGIGTGTRGGLVGLVIPSNYINKHVNQR